MYYRPMSISPESFRGQAVKTPGEHVMKMKPEAVKDVLVDRINGVINCVNPEITLFTMTRDTLSCIERTPSGTWVLNKGKLQKIALRIMEEFGFDPKTSRLEEMSKNREVRTYPSSTHEGVIFKRDLVKSESSSLTQVTWSVHKSTPTNSS